MSKNPKNNGAKSGLQDPKTGKFLPGNPGGGRPPGTLSLIGMLKAKLEEVEPESKRKYAELLIDKIVDGAVTAGDEKQIKNILQYIEGMPQQSIVVEDKSLKLDV